MNDLQATYQTIQFPDLRQQYLSLAWNIIKPVVKMRLSEWAEKYRVVSREVSSRHGMWDNSIAPFAVEIMDAISDDEMEELSFMGSAQVVKTEIILNVIAWIIDQDPGPILLLHPTISVAEAFSKEKLSYMLRDCTRLRGKVSERKSRDSNNTKLEKSFLGGELTIVGGNSASELAQRSKRFIISDDIDRIPVSAGDEGDPVLLAEMRGETYEGLRKKLRFSTPTIKKQSRIEKFYNRSDKRKYYVPCPFCSHEQILVFDNLIWDKEVTDLFGGEQIHHPETVKYACEGCGELIDEKYKYDMIRRGRWKITNPKVTNHRGYWINRLYSPFASWPKIVQDFLDAKDDPQMLKVFYNTSLALCWETEQAKEIDKTGLMQRVEKYLTAEEPGIPEEVLLLTAAVDVQKYRLELLIVGWGLKKESWRIDRIKIPGDPEQDDKVWDVLYEHLTKTYTRRDGYQLKIKLTFLDTGFLPKRVYEFIRLHEPWKLMPIKGVGGYGKPLLSTPYPCDEGRLKRIHIGTNEAKDIIFKRLEIEQPGPKYMHFTEAVCDKEYFEQLTSEAAHKRISSGIEWDEYRKKKDGLRNEVLDLEVYAMAAMERCFVNFEKLKEWQQKKINGGQAGPSDQAEPASPKAPEEPQKTESDKTKPVVKIVRPRRNFINSW